MARFVWVRPTRSGVLMIVGIVVLAALLLGGLFWLKQSGEQARRGEAISTAEQQLQQESDKGVALNEGDKDQDTSKDQQTNNDQTQSESSSAPNEGSSNSSTPQSVTELPQTGPETNLLGPIVVALVTFAAVSYYRSRRSLV
jgi:LPXTG-motif cell wall-anchored protein